MSGRMCIRCGRLMLGNTCAHCPPEMASPPTGKSPKKKLKIGKFIGKKAKKMAPKKKKTIPPSISSQSSQQSYRTAIMPAIPEMPQPLFDEQSVIRWKTTFDMSEEPLIAEFWCKAMSGDIILEGSTYISPNYFGFTAPFNNEHIKVLIPFNTVMDIKPASPIITPTGSEFQLTSTVGRSSTCIQIYTSDHQRHQFFDCLLVKSFATWFRLITENWINR